MAKFSTTIWKRNIQLLEACLPGTIFSNPYLAHSDLWPLHEALSLQVLLSNHQVISLSFQNRSIEQYEKKKTSRGLWVVLSFSFLPFSFPSILKVPLSQKKKCFSYNGNNDSWNAFHKRYYYLDTVLIPLFIYVFEEEQNTLWHKL